MALTNAEKQRAYRERKRGEGLRDRLFYVTEAQEQTIKTFLSGSGPLAPDTNSSIRPVNMKDLSVYQREVFGAKARKLWKEGDGIGGYRRDLEVVRLGLQVIDGDNPGWGFRQAADLVGAKRTDPTPDELARAVKSLYSMGHTMTKIGEILKAWEAGY